MRVIAGKARGHRLKAPRSRQTRPTSDLVRGAIFSTLASLGADLSRVLDLYAGSGALGIEALSRGADWCDFVERNPAACALIRSNLEATGFQDQAGVYCMSVERALPRLQPPYSLVLADPPYADSSALTLLGQVASAVQSPSGELTVVVEHSSAQEAAPTLGPLALFKTRQYGDTQVSFYR
ncbi:MAG TPA: 16S rRNA (guanine(966)-N(2))-methyltransferase RsmD [Dehalococcoidia bacterium]|nr:16S rRNA (guanine(966)-N(2))-methyltransferase RsmD [Dehalococcoidia bacterium]